MRDLKFKELRVGSKDRIAPLKNKFSYALISECNDSIALLQEKGNTSRKRVDTIGPGVSEGLFHVAEVLLNRIKHLRLDEGQCLLPLYQVGGDRLIQLPLHYPQWQSAFYERVEELLFGHVPIVRQELGSPPTTPCR